MRHIAPAAIAVVGTIVAPAAETFDHAYAAYGALLGRHVRHARVDYMGLVADRTKLQAIVSAFAQVASGVERNWAPYERLAFWINAYNLFTLDAVVAGYPIKGSFFSVHPRNSIRQIDGVWTRLTWKAAGREISRFGEPRRELERTIGPAHLPAEDAGAVGQRQGRRDHRDVAH